MYEWLLVRLAMLGVLAGGGVLLALAGNALDRWRERPVRGSGARGKGVASANYRANLARIDAPRSSAQ